jgi:hypothetical protein
MKPTVLILSFFVTLAVAKNGVHFQHWYRQWYSELKETMQTPECLAAYQVHLHDTPSPTDLGSNTSPTVNCILAKIDESKKSNMAAAAVLLGKQTEKEREKCCSPEFRSASDDAQSTVLY